MRRLLVIALTWAAGALECRAVDRITLDIGSVTAPAVVLTNMRLSLEIGSAPASPAVHVHAKSLQVPALGTTLREVDLTCGRAALSQPALACGEGSLTAAHGGAGQLRAKGDVAYDTASDALALRATDLPIAGGLARLRLARRADGWSGEVDAAGIDVAHARELSSRWVSLPRDLSVSGHADLHLNASGPKIAWTATSRDLGVSNSAGTLASQKLVVETTGQLQHLGSAAGATSARLDDAGFLVQARLRSWTGQLLAGPALLDFATDPLDARARLRWGVGDELVVESLEVGAGPMLQASGEGRVRLGEHAAVTQGGLDIGRLSFPAAFRSFLQLPLATTEFGSLETSGTASGRVEVSNGRLARIRARIDRLDVRDPHGRFDVDSLTGDVDWATDDDTKPSTLAWTGSRLYGLSGAGAQIDFSMHADDFSLLHTTRLPILDGALIVHFLAVRHLDSDDPELDFSAHIEPISMSLLSQAFGWPSLAGQLAGRIPAMTYRDHVLEVAGDLTANVFDGTVIASRLQLRDPLGPWPHLDADVTARGLDLDRLTHTFSIGYITGRLDADIHGLELFDWSPVAFDARLHTTPGDDSPHLISQRAVTSISSIGGGAGAVAAALQSGVLKFFQTFHYDEIGIRCQLRDEICLMSGIEPAGDGYYLVKGRGVPRIDIIGNAGRVNWPQLVAQIEASMRGKGIQVR